MALDILGLTEAKCYTFCHKLPLVLDNTWKTVINWSNATNGDTNAGIRIVYLAYTFPVIRTDNTDPFDRGVEKASLEFRHRIEGGGITSTRQFFGDDLTSSTDPANNPVVHEGRGVVLVDAENPLTVPVTTTDQTAETDLQVRYTNWTSSNTPSLIISYQILSSS